MSWLRFTGTGRSAQVLHRLQILETALEQLDRVVECSERDCAMLDDSDDDDWPGGGYSCSPEGRQVEQWKAWPKWRFVMKVYDVAVKQQLSGAEISTDVVSNVQFGGVQLFVVLIMLRTGRGWNRIANA